MIFNIPKIYSYQTLWRNIFNNYQKLLNKLIDDASNDRITGSYSRDNSVKPNANDSFEMNVDCSGLVAYMLRTTKPSAYLEINDFIKKIKQVSADKFKRIFTFDFYDIFEKINEGTYNQKAFDSISDFSNLKKGDIIVYLPPSEQKRRYGHMGIVAGKNIKKISDNIISIDFLHSPTFGEKVQISRLLIRYNKNKIIGISYNDNNKIAPHIGLAGRIR